MPEPLSLDLRERIVAAYERGDLTRDQVAELFQVGRASVNRLVRRFRETGSVEPSPHGGGKPRKLSARGEKALRALVAEHPDATIPEFVRLLMARAKLAVSTSTMSRELTRLGFTRNKKSLVATEQTAPRIQALRDRFRARARALDPRDLVFIDEAGSQIGMTREYARGPRGERVQGYVPRNRGTVTTMIGAMAIDGVRALMTVEGATDAEVFEAFVTHLLVPKLKLGNIVVLDNVGAHKPEGALARIRAAGARVLFLPPYSPDLNPIECCWSKVKAFLKKFEALTVASLDAAIARAVELVTSADARGWFAHCGYSVQPE